MFLVDPLNVDSYQTCHALLPLTPRLAPSKVLVRVLIGLHVAQYSHTYVCRILSSSYGPNEDDKHFFVC